MHFLIRLVLPLGLLLQAGAPLCAQMAPDVTPASVAEAPVQYPAEAVAAGEEGTATVALEVDATGRVHDATLEKSSGHPRLDEAAVRSVAQWSFRPALIRGRAVAQRVRIPVVFQLTSEGDTRGQPPGAATMVAWVMELLGGIVWIFGFAWSLVLAKRRSILWLSGMVALWIVTYPVFLVVHWQSARRSLPLVIAGMALSSLGLYLSSVK